MRRLVIAALAALCVCTTATAAGPAAFRPEAGETGPQAVARMKAALKAPGCNAELRGLYYSGYGAIPSAGCTYLRARLGTFQDVEAKVYGTGAIVDGYIGDRSDNYAESVFV